MTLSAPPFTEYRQWPEQGRWTYADWERLPDDGNRYEVIDGELHVSPPPSTPHQSASNNLATDLTVYVRANHLGDVFTAPIGVRLPNEPVPLQPDIVFVSAARKGIISAQYIEGVPDLVVEILSPSNWVYDRVEKQRVYAEAGIPEYWILDYRAKTIEVLVLEGGEYVLIRRYTVNERVASRVLAGFEIEVAAVFHEW